MLFQLQLLTLVCLLRLFACVNYRLFNVQHKGLLILGSAGNSGVPFLFPASPPDVKLAPIHKCWLLNVPAL
jgi:hypothetical protein